MPGNKPASLPDPARCRALLILTEVAECLVEQPGHCVHARQFGGGHICNHPDRKAIAARTKAAVMKSRRKNAAR